MVKTDSYDPDQTLKRLGIALGLDVDGEHGEPEDIEEEDIQGAICQAQVVVRPPTINKDTGKEEYPEANDIKTWAAKADHFVAPPM
ncbi:MAG: hypothetical protein HC840_01265 [Leptolyngbyaceae cyanobacterium RM2_2_4]|nr:hypothetical protein [Leptolyngbyaceae cyanobacterium RM2_2_4]